MKLMSLLMAVAISNSVTLCSETRPVPVFPLPSGSGAAPLAPVQSMPMAPPPAEDPYAGYETHGVVSPEYCYQMAQRFKQEGRGVRLVQVVKNPYNQGGGLLEWMCVFDGDPEATPFEDDRFPPDNYTYP